MAINSSASCKRPLFNKEEYEQSLFFGPAECEDDKKAEIIKNVQPLCVYYYLVNIYCHEIY